MCTVILFNLKLWRSFTTVPVAVGVCNADFAKAMGQLTKYRRMIRRNNKDNENLPVIFNDYMNCLFGDPTTEKELPLIDAAAEAGCEYFVIDAGWYAPGLWWDSVGEWQECRERFPGGIKEVTDYIDKEIVLLCAVSYLCLDHTAESNWAAVFYIFAFIKFDCDDVLGTRPLRQQIVTKQFE